VTCIFIPDGKAKAMSSITHSIDAAETQKGKGSEAKVDKKAKPPVAEGEEVKLSKKDLAKMAKKEAKAEAKQNAKEGVPTEPKPKGKPAGIPEKSAK